MVTASQHRRYSACAKEFDVKGGHSGRKFQGQTAASPGVAGVAGIGRGGGHVASDYSHQNVGQLELLARGVGICRMVPEHGGPWGCGKGGQGLVDTDEGTGRSQVCLAAAGLRLLHRRVCQLTGPAT